jgi:hypothetical protein
MLTDAERAKAKIYLGYNARSDLYDTGLDTALDAVSDDEDWSAVVTTLLVEIEAVETKLIDAHKRLKAVRVGTIGLDEPRGSSWRELTGLRWEGMRLTGKLSTILGVDRVNNVFSGGSTRQGGRNEF